MADSHHLKLFIGGFKCETTHQEIYSFFKKIGPCKVELKMKRKSKKISLGYCYLKTKDKTMYSQLLNAGKIFFKDRLVEVKPYLRGEDLDNFYEEFNARRVQVYNLPKRTSNEELKIYFSQYGPVENAYTIHDFRCSGETINGFVLFKNFKDAEEVGKIRDFNFSGQEIKARKFSKETGLDKISESDSQSQSYCQVNIQAESNRSLKKSVISKQPSNFSNKKFARGGYRNRFEFDEEEIEFVKKDSIMSESKKNLTDNQSTNYPTNIKSTGLMGSSFGLSSPTLRPGNSRGVFINQKQLQKGGSLILNLNDPKRTEDTEFDRLASFPSPYRQKRQADQKMILQENQCIRLDTFGESDLEPETPLFDNRQQKINPYILNEIDEAEEIEQIKDAKPQRKPIISNHEIRPTMNGYYDQGSRAIIFKYIHDSFNLRVNVIDKQVL